MHAQSLRRAAVILLCCSAPTLDALGQSGVQPEVVVREELCAGDWGSIRAAYQAGRHRAYPVEGGYRAHNPGQHWSTRFDGRGFRVLPDAGSWSWGLELLGYGFAAGEQLVTTPARVHAQDLGVAYEWDDTLTEWYVNDARGLEHGYTVHRRPVREGRALGGPLTFAIAVRGSLRPEVCAAGRNVRFLDGDGAVVLTYDGLSVVDADGQELEARFECSAEGLLLRVEERGARYPLTIDPLAQQEAYLKASNTDAGDRFGISVAVSGDTVVVGANHECSNATGVDGDQSDNSARNSGAAYVFVRSGTTWIQQAYLKASNTDGPPGFPGSTVYGDMFGAAVAVSGDTVVVGALREASSATGVNGDQLDNSAYKAGAAYVFVRNGTTWSQEAYLKASNTEANDRFGWPVTISGDTVGVGAGAESSSATGVNGDQTDNSASGSGAAYVFVRSGTTWSQEAYIKASNTETWDGFAPASLSGDTLVAGAGGEDSNATGVNGDQTDNSLSGAGAAYVFVRTGTTWAQEAYLKASNAAGGFGTACISGDTVVVGAGGEGNSATGVNGDQNLGLAVGSGAAYVFTRSGTTWSQEAYLKASNTDWYDGFGGSVSVSGDTVVVGATGERSGDGGVDGDQDNNNAPGAGAAYVFVRTGTFWSQEAYLKASTVDNHSESFGNSLSVSGDTLVVAAVEEASAATGVNGAQWDNSAPYAGAAYVFDLNNETLGTRFCLGDATCPCANAPEPGSRRGCLNGSGYGAQLQASGTPSVSADSLKVMVHMASPFDVGIFVQNISVAAPAPFYNGLICLPLDSHLIRHYAPPAVPPTVTDPGGRGRNSRLMTTGDYLGDTQPGATLYYQFWYRDNLGHGPTCTAGSNFSSGVAIVWGP